MDDDGVAQFQDSYIALSIRLLDKSIAIDLENLSQGPIKLDWNLCAFVDASGRSLRVIHKGIRFMEIEAVIPPALIPSHATHSTRVIPADRVFYSKLVHEWQITDLLPGDSDPVGKSVTLFLPLVVNRIARNYTFRLKVTE
jgi:hypothetical protein